MERRRLGGQSELEASLRNFASNLLLSCRVLSAGCCELQPFGCCFSSPGAGLGAGAVLWGPVCKALPCHPQVGILDVDLCGPSIPRMFRVQDSAVHQCDSGWVPVFVDQEKSISLMSIGFLLEKPDDAVVWRGPKKNGTVSSCCLQSSVRSAKPLRGAAGSCSAGLSPQVSSSSQAGHLLFLQL